MHLAVRYAEKSSTDLEELVAEPPSFAVSNTDLRSANLDKAHRGIVKLSCLAPFRPRSATSKSLCVRQTVGAGRAAWSDSFVQQRPPAIQSTLSD